MTNSYEIEKDTILFVGNYNRVDYLTLLQECLDYMSFYFIYFSSKKEETSILYKSYGSAIYWKDYTDAYNLLNQIKPSKTIFLHIDTYTEVALNVACKEMSIKTYILDHGVRDINFNLVSENTHPKQHVLYRFADKLHPRISILNRLKTRLFFLNTVRKSERQPKEFLQEYFKVRRNNSSRLSRKLLPSPYLLPDVYLSFSPFVYKAHIAFDAPPQDQLVHYIGIPYLDKLTKTKPFFISKNKILFIDQAFVTQKILGWTPDSKQKFNQELTNFCERNHLKLIVKEHPLEKNSMWGQIQSKIIEIDNITPIETLAANVHLVIGFYSTLLLGLAALPHITLLTYEGHPAGYFGLSDFLVSRGVSKAFNKIEELEVIISESPKVKAEQAIHKDAFIKECLYRFDGRSGERLRQYLLL